MGAMECNLDPSIVIDLNMIGFGMVIRDEHGVFVACHSSCKLRIPLVKEAEALCLLEALQWTQAHGNVKHYF